MKNPFKKFPFVAQHDAMDCGPACLAMISQYYCKKHSLQYLRQQSYLSRDGVSMLGLSQAADTIGLDNMGLRTDINDIIKNEIYPSILFWENCHFVVLYDVKKSLFSHRRKFCLADPSAGFFNVSQEDFAQRWYCQREQGILLALEPNEKFYQLCDSNTEKIRFSQIIAKYIKPHVGTLLKLAFCMAAGSILTLALPVLAQILIDEGVSAKDINAVTLVLVAQIAIFAGATMVDILRNFLALRIGTKINVSIVSDFFRKMLRLPMGFFDTKFLGDFHQRIHDHDRIEYFLTSQSFTTFFSMVNFAIYFVVLFGYGVKILMAYLALSALSVVWSSYFMRRREIIDFLRFRSSALNQECINEMVNGIQDIKLNNLEDQKIDKWEAIQSETFGINNKALSLDQMQMTGFDFINNAKNLIVTYLAALSVIDGTLTIGGMMSISYIIGQLNSPINQMVSFFRTAQDARLSMERLSEVQTMQEEHAIQVQSANNDEKFQGIELKDVSFQYEGPSSPFALNDVSIRIPRGKTTAIVGASGSGKTTLMKLLLNFYPPTNGKIIVDGIDLQSLAPSQWRQKCGTVLQDGYIFSDSIARNITAALPIDNQKLKRAIEFASIKTLPQKENTMIGAMGNGMSGGQRQRILIARAIYKNPDYIFFDEATSALDTANENTIQKNIHKVFSGKTVVVIAHRLSTIKDADQIIVLNNGKVSEQGTHNSLLQQKGVYYNLVKNQLEMQNG